MVSFNSSKIKFSNTDIGEELKEARISRGLEMEPAAQEIGINHNYIRAMEEGRFYDLPKGLYQKKYIKEYAGFLGMDAGRLIEDLGESGFLEKRAESKAFSRKVISSQAVVVPRLLKNLIILGVVVVCFAYLVNRFENIARPPYLKVVYPGENIITQDRNIDVRGVTEAEAQITINGNQVLSDNSGNFSKNVNLRSGINTITIKARKKFGNELTIVKQVLVKDQQ